MLLWNALEGVFKENLGAVILSLPNLKLREVDKELLVEGPLAELSESTLKVKTSIPMVALVFFEVSSLDK